MGKNRATTKKDGSFIIKNIKPGKITLDASHPEYCDSKQMDLVVVEKQKIVGIKILLEKGSSIIGKVYMDGLEKQGP